MGIKKILLYAFMLVAVSPATAGLFSDQAPVQDGLNVIEVSKKFAEIYQRLNDVNWAGKHIGVAVESLENMSADAHIAATDRRVVLVWGDTIVANFPRPSDGDWDEYGEITTALILKMRENDAELRRAAPDQIYEAVVDGLMRGIDESGRYLNRDTVAATDDNRILTTSGIEGGRDARGNFRVSGVFKDSPADAVGVRAGDLIAEINGRAVTQMDDGELGSAISGFNSGTAKVKLLTPAGERDVVLRRATVILADADIIHRKDGDTELLEIVVHRVSDGAVAIVNEALAKYPNAGGIMLDLRAADGSDGVAAAKLAGLFIGAVPVMRIVETAVEEVEVVPGAGASTNAPVVVLTSDVTRGTAEAIAAAFYENARGVLVGTPTAGAARIASHIDLSDGSALELMNKSIKTGSGREIDARGVFPIVCLSNIRTTAQQNAFFVNVVNNDFNAVDFNQVSDVDPAAVRRGCPRIISGTDEDAMAAAVAAKILTDGAVYDALVKK